MKTIFDVVGDKDNKYLDNHDRIWPKVSIVPDKGDIVNVKEDSIQWCKDNNLSLKFKVRNREFCDDIVFINLVREH